MKFKNYILLSHSITLGVFAESESSLRREHQMEGITAAKARGVHRGRKPSINPAERWRRYTTVEDGAAVRFTQKSSKAMPGRQESQFFGVMTVNFRVLPHSESPDASTLKNPSPRSPILILHATRLAFFELTTKIRLAVTVRCNSGA